MSESASFPDPAARRPAAWPRLDHGLIGNCRVAALIAPSSAVEWLCLPHFDSPSVFGRLLAPALRPPPSACRFRPAAPLWPRAGLDGGDAFGLAGQLRTGAPPSDH